MAQVLSLEPGLFNAQLVEADGFGLVYEDALQRAITPAPMQRPAPWSYRPFHGTPRTFHGLSYTTNHPPSATGYAHAHITRRRVTLHADPPIQPGLQKSPDLSQNLRSPTYITVLVGGQKCRMFTFVAPVFTITFTNMPTLTWPVPFGVLLLTFVP